VTRTLTLCASLLAFTGLLSAARELPSALPEDKNATGKPPPAPLAGGYTVVSGEKDGQVIPPERIRGSVVRFTENRITGTDKDKKEFFAATYTLDTSKKPWVIAMKSTSPKEAEAGGLVKVDGDTLTIIYSLPGGAAPTDFKTKEKQHLFVLKRVKLDPGAIEKKP